MDVAILLFEGLTALDAVGPYEVLSRAPQANVRFVAPASGAIRTANGMLTLDAGAGFDDVTAADVLVVPGGRGSRALEEHQPTLDWIRRVHDTSRFTAGVCTGGLLLGAAGLLDGHPATTHWAYRDRLEQFGAEPVDDRVVRSGKLWTSAGVSAGIDMALALLVELGGPKLAREVQLQIEYDPQPPFDAGHPSKSKPDVVERVRHRLRG